MLSSVSTLLHSWLAYSFCHTVNTEKETKSRHKATKSQSHFSHSDFGFNTNLIYVIFLFTCSGFTPASLWNSASIYVSHRLCWCSDSYHNIFSLREHQDQIVNGKDFNKLHIIVFIFVLLRAFTIYSFSKTLYPWFPQRD